jgi:hypothetical protein
MGDFQVAELVVAELAGSRTHCFGSLGLAVTLLYLLARRQGVATVASNVAIHADVSL